MTDADSTPARRRGIRRQLLVGLAAIPLSVLPFVAYGTWTPQGRLLADQIAVRIDPPTLPEVGAAEAAQLRSLVPDYRDVVMPLVYHGVGSDTAAEGDLAVSPDRFAEQLAALRAAGMHFVTAAQVAEAFQGGRPLPDRAVLITFDDGRSDAVLWATPLLEEAGARATMFTITGAAEETSPYYAGWGDLDEDVWDLQSHTADQHHHQDVGDEDLPALTSRAPGESLQEWRARVRDDLDRADAEIEEHTGRRPVAFAYPFGAWGAERTNDPALGPALLQLLADRYRLAFHQDEQESVPLAGALSPGLGIRRLEVGDWSGEELLRRIGASAERTLRQLPPPGAG